MSFYHSPEREGATGSVVSASNRPTNHSSFCLSTIKSKPYFAVAAKNYPLQQIGNLARMPIAFGTAVAWHLMRFFLTLCGSSAISDIIVMSEHTKKIQMVAPVLREHAAISFVIARWRCGDSCSDSRKDLSHN